MLAIPWGSPGGSGLESGHLFHTRRLCHIRKAFQLHEPHLWNRNRYVPLAGLCREGNEGVRRRALLNGEAQRPYFRLRPIILQSPHPFLEVVSPFAHCPVRSHESIGRQEAESLVRRHPGESAGLCLSGASGSGEDWETFLLGLLHLLPAPSGLSSPLATSARRVETGYHLLLPARPASRPEGMPRPHVRVNVLRLLGAERGRPGEHHRGLQRREGAAETRERNSTFLWFCQSASCF